MNPRFSIKRWIAIAVMLEVISGPLVWLDGSIYTAVTLKSAIAQSQHANQAATLPMGNAPTDAYHVFLPGVTAPPPPPPDSGSWPMAGANPQRTSWTSEEVRGSLQPMWYRPIDPFIPPHVQIIAANDTLYVSTARGLYALDADTGAQRWVYPTELPLGNSPTIADGVAYVGGFDHKLHAINALNGKGLWTFEADAGFDTNPLVVNGIIYAGNRDGNLYAVYADNMPARGTLAWKYSTGGPIHFSAAYNNGMVYFASDDSYAYALNARTGALVWKSAKLPTGDGFHSWWPVIDGNMIILSSSKGYRVLDPPQTDWSSLIYTKEDDVGPPETGGYTKPMGPRLPDGSMDATQAMQYLERKPWRRTYFVLEAATGREVTSDYDHDGKPEYAPLLNAGTNSGTRYPAVIGPDNTIYTFNAYSGSKYGQSVAGWRPGDLKITTPSSGVTAPDEPLAYSAGGNVIYYTQCCDRSAGGFDMRGSSEWHIFAYNLDTLMPGYDVKYTGTDESRAVAVYGGRNGVYGSHGDQNPPIPYKGKIYLHRSNAILAFGPTGPATRLSMLPTVTVQDSLTPVDVNTLEQKLTTEIQKIIDAGHLRPGYGALGNFAMSARSQIGDNLADYWSNPSDTLLVLSRSLPYLPADVQQRLRTYLQNEYTNYSPCDYTHIGWQSGAAREAFDLPPEITNDLPSYWNAPKTSTQFGPWNGDRAPYMYYALWKYALVAGNPQSTARSILTACGGKLSSPPGAATFAEFPFAQNAFIAGYTGYLELQKLAGYTEDAAKRATLNQLLSSRAANFTKDNPWGPDAHNDGQILSVARNFMYMTPELGSYLRANALNKVQAAFDEYSATAPYWFVTKFEATYNEGVMQPLYDYNAMFAAKALIFNASREDLTRYLDVPAFARGDLFYLQNLILTIEAHSTASSGAPNRVPFSAAEVATESALTAPGGTSPFEVHVASTIPAPATATQDAQSLSSPIASHVLTPEAYLPTILASPKVDRLALGPIEPLTTSVGRYQKFEVAFRITTTADNLYFPYDPNALLGQTGISVDMLLTGPNGETKSLPCFYYQPVDANLTPLGQADWRCRFAPETIGTWRYQIQAIDENGTVTSQGQQFSVGPSASRGFIRVSATDRRYFEYSDGSPFVAPLVNVESGSPLNGLDEIRANIPLWGQNGVRFVRWFPTGEGANHYIIPFGDNISSSWGFGPASVMPEGEPGTTQHFTFKPYYYTSQVVPAKPGLRYRLSFRAMVSGDKVFRPQLGSNLLTIQHADWRDYTLETVADQDYLVVALHDGFSESDNTDGKIRIYNIELHGDDTGHGDWGPNLLARGNPDTFNYVDQLGAARLDEVMRLSEQYGVYHKLTLFHKNDEVLAQMAADGSVTNWSIDHFYSRPGEVVNRLERAYARYFVARWSYSTALHSLELGNENNLTQNSYDAAFDILGYVRALSPRHILLSNSFWGYLAVDFWNDPTRGNLMDYADKHWYARPDSDNPELVSTVAFDSAGNVRECERAFANYDSHYHLNKPIVRGETSVWQPNGSYDQLNLGVGAATFYHKQLWAQMGDQCDGEWYSAYLSDQNLWGMFGTYEHFLQDEPLSNGHYVDIGTDGGRIAVSNASGSLRAWGKLDATAGRGILFVDNGNDTWKHVADGMNVGAASGTLAISGLPNGAYTITWQNTYDSTSMTSTQAVSSGTLALSFHTVQRDMAIKFKLQ